jgi:Protein of unknown function (DUF3443)
MNAPARSILLVAQLLLAACNGGDQKIVTNAMPLEVSAFDTSGTPNLLFTTLTICDTNSNCQTIDHIQVDTGSGGLRIFRQALTVGLTQTLNNQGAALAVREHFAIGSAWGSVQTASVKLASEPAITIPVQVIDATFGTQPPPSECGGAWRSPMDIHANGILGIDVGVQDSGVYFTCQANACTQFAPSAAQRVANPVLALPVDNNGVIISLPGIPDDGQATVYGTLVLGIGTTWDNDPKTYSTNPVVTVNLNTNDPFFASTTADQVSFSLFAVDTGSNAYAFTDPAIRLCPSLFSSVLGLGGWYCPVVPKNFAVRVMGTSGPAWNFQVWIRDEKTLTGTGNLAFNDLGIDLRLQDFFIAGLPFFYGKQVYLGYATKSSSLGNGPLYGYALR